MSSIIRNTCNFSIICIITIFITWGQLPLPGISASWNSLFTDQLFPWEIAQAEEFGN